MADPAVNFQPHTTGSWVNANEGVIDYLIRNTCGTYYVYRGTRYVGAAVDYLAAEKLARHDQTIQRKT